MNWSVVTLESWRYAHVVLGWEQCHYMRWYLMTLPKIFPHVGKVGKLYKISPSRGDRRNYGQARNDVRPARKS